MKEVYQLNATGWFCMNYPVHCQFSRSLRDDENDENDTAETCPWCGAMGKLRCGNLYELVNEVRGMAGQPFNGPYKGIGNGKIMGWCLGLFQEFQWFIWIYIDLNGCMWICMDLDGFVTNNMGIYRIQGHQWDLFMIVLTMRWHRSPK